MVQAGGDTGDNGSGAAADVTGVGGHGGRTGGAGLWGSGWKRIAIAGAALSSAPMVLPPLLLLSAVGLAFSVPFGVFFAGYACTDKIMRSLLPTPSIPSQPLGEVEEEEEMLGGQDDEGIEVEADKGHMEMGIAEQESRAVEEHPQAEEEPVAAALNEDEEKQIEEKAVERGQVSEGEGESAARGQVFQEREGGKEEEESRCVPPPKADELAISSAPDREEKPEKMVVEEGRQAEEGEKREEGGGSLAGVDKRRISAPKNEKKQVEQEDISEGVVARVDADDGGVTNPEGGPQKRLDDNGHVKEQEEKRVEEGVLLFDTDRGFIPAPPPGARVAVEEGIEEKQQVQEGKGKAMISAVVLVHEGSIICSPEVEAGRVKEKTILEAKGQEEGRLIPVEKVESESVRVPEGEELAEVSTAVGSPDVLVTILEHEILIEPSRFDVEEQLSEAADAGSEESVVHPELQHRSPAVSAPLDSDEDLYNEEKIWEQIDAIRTIVGYKAPRHSSCIQELEALYLLMGVEPAVSFEDASGLKDVNKKLRFLKSIIGVK